MSMKIVSLFRDFGQSLWLDYIDRNLVDDGGLKALVGEGVRGVTSNPTIFHRAITQSSYYDEGIRDLIQADPNIGAAGLYQWLTLQDVLMAADVLRSVYDSSNGMDGYVSIEISPHLAHDTAATVEAVKRLWQQLHRPNVMIKVPATAEGIPAIKRLLAEGININATLLFSLQRYEQVADAYLQGLEMSSDPRQLASVASMFVSRIDTRVDQALEAIGTPEARKLKGRIAIANAKMAYQSYRRIFEGSDFAGFRERGVKPQRLLWGSTSTKNPGYPDAFYVNGLIGANTINTVPPQTLDAFQVHGELGPALETGVDEARRDLESLAALGIDLVAITGQLEEEGVAGFVESYDQLMAVLEDKRNAVAMSFAG